MVKFSVYGAVNDPNTYYCEYLAKRLADLIGNSEVEIFTFLEIDFWLKVDELKNTVDHRLLHLVSTNVVIINDQKAIGDIKDLIHYAEKEHKMEDAEIANTVVFNRQVREGTYDVYSVIQRPIITIQFMQQDGKRLHDFADLGAINIELMIDLCPKACRNFMKLIEGFKVPSEPDRTYHYMDCPVHRIVKDGWIQSGDVVSGNGKSSISVLDENYSTGEGLGDESFSMDFGFARGGIVGYANNGTHTNRSQFFITLAPCAWMNNKFVGFGRVIQGFDTLRRLNAVQTSNQVPIQTVKIGHCGRAPESVNHHFSANSL